MGNEVFPYGYEAEATATRLVAQEQPETTVAVQVAPLSTDAVP